MPLPAALRMRLGLTCSNASLSLALVGASRPANAQRRVSRTLVSSIASTATTRPIRNHRSPHQWSHIVHHSRNPSALSASPATMATSIQSNAPQARAHAGHSHSHHHHDNTYLTSTNSRDPGVRITRIGLYVNLGMAIAKGAGGYIFNSQA